MIAWVGTEKRQGVIDPAKALIVTGVVSDTRHASLDDPGGFEMYSALRPGWESPDNWILIRSAAPLPAISSELRSIMAQIPLSASVSHLQTLDQVVSASAASPRALTVLLVALAGVAAIVGTVGIYSLVAYIVSWRRREIGLRLALGAGRRQVAASVVRQSLAMTLAGGLCGLAGAVFTSHLLAKMLFDVHPFDPLAYFATLALLLVLGSAAALVPAWRAAHVDPMEAMRAE